MAETQNQVAATGLTSGSILRDGFIETEMTQGMKPEALAKFAAGIPLQRMARPDEIAHSAAFIFENDYYTGRIIECDGGLRL
jgi:3-oxoacyl-[acyl-carrier protein] reductase